MWPGRRSARSGQRVRRPRPERVARASGWLRWGRLAQPADPLPGNHEPHAAAVRVDHASVAEHLGELRTQLPEPPLELLGVPWPHMPFHDVPVAIQWAVLDWAEGVHALLVLCLLVMVPLHVAAALKHHFWDKHDTLIGMLPVLEQDEEQPQAPRPGLPDAGLPDPAPPPAPARG